MHQIEFDQLILLGHRRDFLKHYQLNLEVQEYQKEKNFFLTLLVPSFLCIWHDSTDIFRVLLAKLIEKPEEQQTFNTLLELAEKIAAKH